MAHLKYVRTSLSASAALIIFFFLRSKPNILTSKEMIPKCLKGTFALVYSYLFQYHGALHRNGMMHIEIYIVIVIVAMGKNCLDQTKFAENQKPAKILSFGRAYIIRMNRFFFVVVNASMNIAKNTINKA